MIYVETSVLLAELLAEDRVPPPTLWTQPLITSRLAEYEMWTRIHARKLGPSHGEQLRLLLGRLAFLEMTPVVLSRALDAFPVVVRTLDALHLASMDFLRSNGQAVELASYDNRVITAARALGVPIHALG